MSGKAYQTIALERDGKVARLWLERPEVHNAFNAVMIRELRDALRVLAADPSARVLVLSGRGASFCAGADLNWIAKIAILSSRTSRNRSTWPSSITSSTRSPSRPSPG
jgi:enoyl-CoA hydratase/carnithine racemase